MIVDGIVAAERYYAGLPYTETGNNHNIFSDIVNSYGLAGYQDAAWCATYQFAIELMVCGKSAALSNWCMTDRYVGYSVFATRDKFKAKGKTGSAPKRGALVIFKRSHMGRVLSVNGSTFECGEGNTSNAQFNRDGDSCAVKTYSATDPGIDCFCYIDYGDKMTPTDIIKATKAVYEMARNGHYTYGDSKTLPPCADGLISCDRLVARALYNLGFTKQPAGGITVLNMQTFLRDWGFTRIDNSYNLQAGDIVLFRDGSTTPNANWHTFVLAAYRAPNDISKYDEGAQWRISAAQPFNTILNEWGGNRVFLCAYRWADTTDYRFTPSELTIGANNNSAYLASEILKARNYRGVYKDGKRQSLALDFKWTKGDKAAAAAYVADRLSNNAKLTVTAGDVNRALWVDMLGSDLPFTAVELPTKQTQGVVVLLCQEILRARGVKGKDGKALTLTYKWDDNLAYAVKKYQKIRKLKETGIVDRDTWYDMIGL